MCALGFGNYKAAVLLVSLINLEQHVPDSKVSYKHVILVINNKKHNQTMSNYWELVLLIYRAHILVRLYAEMSD